MTTRQIFAIPTTALAALVSVSLIGNPAHADPMKQTAMPSDRAVDKVLASWPARPMLAAEELMLEYGPPQEVTPEQLIWRNQGPFKRITVSREEIPHDFPQPHMDYVMHTIDYIVPAAKLAALAAFDGSIIVDRTAGELSSRGDSEAHNILVLNLANDLAMGKKDSKQARLALAKYILADLEGENPVYLGALQFVPTTKIGAPDADVVIIAGAPRRATDMAKDESTPMTDAEVLAMVAAIDENEIMAADVAMRKKLSPQVQGFAQMMHNEHGRNVEDTYKLGLKLKVTPLETSRVEVMKFKGAGELAALVPLQGAAFEMAYINAMVKGHADVLSMIDNKLMPAATSEAVRHFLVETRGHVAMHLEAAKKIQAELKSGQVTTTR